jgi:hypothetical protein
MSLIILPSGATEAIGFSYDYTIPLNLDLDPEKNYEAALIDCSFSNPGPTGNSVFINIDFIENQQLGHNYYPILYKTRPMTSEIIVGDPTTETYYEKENGSIIQWRKIIKHSINNVRVTIYESNGTPIPVTKYSMVQIIIREV